MGVFLKQFSRSRSTRQNNGFALLNSNKNQPKAEKRSFLSFRRKNKKSSAPDLTIEPQITWTASDPFSDEESPVNENHHTHDVLDDVLDDILSDDNIATVDAANHTPGAPVVPSPKAQKIAKMIFHSEESKLAELQQLHEKQQEIDRMMQQEIDKMQDVLDELMNDLQAKEEQLEETEIELANTMEELAEVKQECSDLVDVLSGTEELLEKKTEELNVVSSTLIQCQEQLYNRTNGVFSWFQLEPKVKV